MIIYFLLRDDTIYNIIFELQPEDKSAHRDAENLAKKHPGKNIILSLNDSGMLVMRYHNGLATVAIDDELLHAARSHLKPGTIIRGLVVGHSNYIAALGPQGLSDTIGALLAKFTSVADREKTDSSDFSASPDRFVIASCPLNNVEDFAQQLLVDYGGKHDGGKHDGGKQHVTVGTYTTKVSANDAGNKIFASGGERIDYWLNENKQLVKKIIPLAHEAKPWRIVPEDEAGRIAWLAEEVAIWQRDVAALSESINSLVRGEQFFHELSTEARSRVAQFLTPEEIAGLSSGDPDSLALLNAVKKLNERVTTQPETLEGLNGKSALAAMLNEDASALQTLSEKLGISDDPTADREAGRIVQQGILLQEGEAHVPPDSYRLRTLGRIARLGLAMPTVVTAGSSRAVMLSGSFAALSRIENINQRLKSTNLSAEERHNITAEKALAEAELGSDLGGELAELMGRTVRLAGIAMSALGAGFAWYGVHAASQELKALITLRNGALPVQKAELDNTIEQLRVSLGVNIATAILSTGMAAGAVITAVGGTAAAVAVAPLMAVGGPLLAAAFIGLWVYNGIKTVEEFSKYMTLTGWEKFSLGFGSLFGRLPARLQQTYNVEKLKIVLKEYMQSERSRLADQHPDIATFVEAPVFVEPGGISTIVYQGLNGSGTYQEAMAAVSRQPAVDVDMNLERYRVFHDEAVARSALFHERETVRRYPSIADKTGYTHSSHLALLNTSWGDPEVVALPAGRWKASNTLTGNFSDVVAGNEIIRASWLGYKPFVEIYRPDRSRVEHFSWTGSKKNITSETVLHSLVRVRSAGAAFDDALILLSDQVIALKGGKQGFAEVSFPATADLLRATSDPDSRIAAVSEAEGVTLFVTKERGDSVKVFRYQRQNNGSYLPGSSFSDNSSFLKEMLTSGAQPFFHDLNQDDLADLVVVKTDKTGQGALSVALRTRRGEFIKSDDFDFYRQEASQERITFADHKILGFGDSAHTLLTRS